MRAWSVRRNLSVGGFSFNAFGPRRRNSWPVAHRRTTKTLAFDQEGTDQGAGQQQGTGASSHAGQSPPQQGTGAGSHAGQSPPLLRGGDKDLIEVLLMATEDELASLYDIMFGRSLLSPLVKSLAAETADPPSARWWGREELILRLEQRFRFLAADATGVLRGRWPSYRETLLHVRERLEVPCPAHLSTPDLETEVFLVLLQRHADWVGGVSQDSYSAAAAAHALDGDGMDGQARPHEKQPNPLQRLLAPLKLGQHEVTEALASLAGALAVAGAKRTALRELGVQVLKWHTRYEAAAAALMAAGAAKGGGAAAVQVAQKGLTAALGRYAAVRGALSLVGPLMWLALAADLARMSMGTDYVRVLKVVFRLAEIRLLRTHGFQNA